MGKIVKSLILVTVGVFLLLWYCISTDTFMYCLNTVMYYLNQPLPIIGISVTTVLIFAWKIFSSSSIGKKQLVEFKKENEELRKQIKEYEQLTEVTINELKNHYEGKIEAVNSQFNLFEKWFIEIVEKIPNKKVQEAVLEYKSLYDEKKAEIETLIIDNYPFIDEKIKELNELKENIERMLEEYGKEANEETGD